MTARPSRIARRVALVAVPAWALGCADLAVSQPQGGMPPPPPRDSGNYRILHARYGTAEHNVDVTPRLRELAARDMTFRVSNDVFGTDPHPNVVKVLRIHARGPDGQVRTFDYGEGQFVPGAEFVGWAAGNWGRDAWSGGWGAPTAPAQDRGSYTILNARYGTAERNVDVTPRLRDLARRDASFRVSNDLFGTDPHPNVVKTLRIHARGPDGQNRTFDYAEGQFVQGSQFIGWASGNWGQGGWNGGWGGGPGPGTPPPGQDRGEFQILHARYGTAERNIDVTPRLRELARRDASFRVANTLFGNDPHPNVVKTLRIFARGPGGQTRTFDYLEGQVVQGSRFVGWSNGNWGDGRWAGGWNGR